MIWGRKLPANSGLKADSGPNIIKPVQAQPRGGHSDGKSMGRLAVFFRGLNFNGEGIF